MRSRKSSDPMNRPSYSTEDYESPTSAELTPRERHDADQRRRYVLRSLRHFMRRQCIAFVK